LSVLDVSLVTPVTEPEQNWWDNFKNTLWDSMGRSAKVGHNKLLPSIDCLVPPLGTTSCSQMFAVVRNVRKNKSIEDDLIAVVLL